LSQFEKDAILAARRDINPVDVRYLRSRVELTNTLTQIEQAKQLEEIARALGAIVLALEAIEGNLRG
jgi:hypothetical protein